MTGDDIDVRVGAHSQDAYLVASVLAQSRADVLRVLEALFAERKRTGYGPLYDLLADYPFREGKGLRPAICFSACRAAGGRIEQAMNSAAALELFPDGEVVGIDLAAGMVVAAHRAARSHGLDHCAFFQSDVGELPSLFDGQFDMVYNCLAHHHYPDPPAAARAIIRCLRPGGLYCVIDPGPAWFNAMSAGIAKKTDPGWIGFHTPDEYRELLLAAGFARVRWEELLPGFGLVTAQAPHDSAQPRVA